MIPHYFGKVKSPNLPQFMEVNWRNNITFDRIWNILCQR